MKQQQIAVVGLGRFGSAVAGALEAAGHEVMGIDLDMEAVDRMAPLLSHVVALDATDETALRRTGVAEFDAAVVSIAEHLESSILTTMLLKRIGVPRVVAKAGAELHAEILQRVGADQVVFPERDTGIRLAASWSSQSIVDSLDVVPGYSVHRVVAPAKFVGHTISEIDVHGRFGIHLFVVAREAEVNVFPADNHIVQAGDLLVIAGEAADIERALS